jgi:hypothetical protein
MPVISVFKRLKHKDHELESLVPTLSKVTKAEILGERALKHSYLDS